MYRRYQIISVVKHENLEKYEINNTMHALSYYGTYDANGTCDTADKCDRAEGMMQTWV